MVASQRHIHWVTLKTDGWLLGKRTKCTIYALIRTGGKPYRTFKAECMCCLCVYVWSLGFPRICTNLLQKRILNYISPKPPHCGNPQRYASLGYYSFIWSHAMQLRMRNAFLKVWKAYRKVRNSNSKIISLFLGHPLLTFLKQEVFRGCVLTPPLHLAAVLLSNELWTLNLSLPRSPFPDALGELMPSSWFCFSKVK